ncbi:putative leucine-rich repeat domain superfamily [Helianthus annuus]|nr:putative leucine-rich repeat domain superfamily [Helianthus annuus]
MASIHLQAFSLVYFLLLLTCTSTSFLNHDDEECVYCSSNKGHVIELDWSESSLSGIINSNSTLFKLVHLQVLNLSMNNFVESQIPHEIACLKQLRSLDLSYSGFYGRIPNEISQLTQLISLDISGNPLKLHSSGLGYLLKNMTRLEYLDLSEVDLSSSVPRFLANFSSLRSIGLRDCQLQDEFPSAIFHLPKLKHLSLAKNLKLTGLLPEFHNNTLLENLNLFQTGFSGVIPESIGNLNLLYFLSFDGCNFSGRIPASLTNLTQLTHLSLYENEFTGHVPSLASLSKLTVLALGYINVVMEGVYDWVNKLTKLNTLILDGMNIQGEILPHLANLTKLSVVSMAENFIFGRIPSSFMNLTHLTVFDYNRNQLQGKISNSFLNFKSLEYLDVSENNFSGTVGIDSFLGLNKLEHIDLSHNSLSFVTTTNYTNATLPALTTLVLASCNLKEFPAFLRFQTKLTRLSLGYNEIEGLVPDWIWNNSQETLRMFSMKNNFITGFHQHPRFLPWIRLEIFMVPYNELRGRLPIPPHTIVVYHVANNNLTGEIPSWICEVKSLQVLDISSNMMTGTLPQCLGNLSNSLSYLDLKQNNFHGPMLNTSHGCLLKKIDLSENRFSGKVSRSLANCINLEFLSLASNSFEDVFPLWLGTPHKLQVLILRSNKFYGAIQGLSSSQFLQLRIIDISNNGFSGQLPHKSFQNWNAMKSVNLSRSFAMEDMISNSNTYATSTFMFQYSMTLTNKGVKREYTKILNIFTAIDLSCNNFKGQIPQSLQDLHGLESLNLSHNHFTGHILPSLGNLKNLESLDLFQNELSGQIPQQLLQLGFLAFLNVSYNHLDGCIPQGKQFNTFENNSYLGNPGLCGKPLSKECDNSKVPTVLPPTTRNEYVSLLPGDIIDWMVILLGVGSGLIIGIVIGNLLYARYGDWFLERLGMRKNRWVRPLRNTTRN